MVISSRSATMWKLLVWSNLGTGSSTRPQILVYSRQLCQTHSNTNELDQVHIFVWLSWKIAWQLFTLSGNFHIDEQSETCYGQANYWIQPPPPLPNSNIARGTRDPGYCLCISISIACFNFNFRDKLRYGVNTLGLLYLCITGFYIHELMSGTHFHFLKNAIWDGCSTVG